MQPKTAMIFAAGFGTRMRHLTQSTPKPLVSVMGKPMIDHSLAMLSDAGIKSVFINTHYLADQLEDHVKNYPFATAIRENPDILETGGGLKNALPLIGTDPVFTLTCDAVWFGESPITELEKHWAPEQMDGLLMLIKKPNCIGYAGTGDFFLNPKNILQPKHKADAAPYVYSGVQIIKTDLLKTIPQNSFSIWRLWEKMLAQDRLFGTVYNGAWADVGHPEGIDLANRKAANV